MFHIRVNRSFSAESHHMDRPLALGGAGGAVTSLVLSLLRGLSREVDFQSAADALRVASDCVCPALAPEDLPWIFLIVGFLAGVLVGPALDICWLIRQRWTRFIWSQVAAANPPGPRPTTYRV